MPDNIKMMYLKEKTILSNVTNGKQLALLRDISIWLETYDDIFSDFDPKAYSERVLSDDFLVEIRKVSYEKKE